MLLVDTTSGEGIVVDANPAALRQLQAEVTQPPGFPLRAFYPPNQPDGKDSAILAREYFRRAAHGQAVRFSWRFVRPDQTVFDSDVTLSRIGDSERDFQIAIIREISENPPVASEQLLRERTVQLNAVTAELDAFSYAVSHDLRAAILGIAACSRIIVDDFGAGMTEEARRWLSHIHDDSVQLDKLTDALLALSRASRSEMDPVDVDLTSMARVIARGLHAENDGRNVEFRISDDLTAHGDQALLQILLRNLFHNAWKSTAKTTDSRIELGCLPRNPADKTSIFYVRDNGIGFDMALAARLFVPFQRLHNDQDFGGNGIGLATVRRIVHRHGGKVWAEGTPGGGATFFFELKSRTT